ncbi:LON peptidase substrate-binding domain-containing protein [Oecophyllibacter saccharovorans]|uniref:LON peptidase substrate-binding domain-containing protein n=1 Tax=Oecophyllibacter saccharovorans TaxID=2558360 RepID=UPI001E43F01F|nr:LON peptidase substrate-binding domain-containing protein [Oecophyllibacter saccharovorans]
MADIPPNVGLFPLRGTLLLPNGHLPLHIYEPRYIALMEHALATTRLIGVIQPYGMTAFGRPAPLQSTGTLGRITAFEEGSDGRFSLTLTGVCRFRLLQAERREEGWREGRIDIFPYSHDLLESTAPLLDRPALKRSLKHYFERHQLETDWKKLEALDDETLLIALPMILPLDAGDKQALLEAPDLNERASLLFDMLDQD